MNSVLVVLVAFLAGRGVPDLEGVDRGGVAPRAAEAYAAGRYAEAHALLSAELERRGAERASAALLYDLGLCAYRLERLPEAALHLRRALLRAPGDAAARRVLRRTEDRLGLPAPAGGGAAAWLERWTSLAPRARLALAAVLQAAGLGALVLLRRAAPRLLAAVLLAAGLAAGVDAAWRERRSRATTAVVLGDGIRVRPEPHAGYGALFELRAGEVIELREASERWARIAHERGGGWTERAGIGIVD